MAEFDVRPMTPDDVPEMVAMYSQAWIDTYVSPEHGVQAEWVLERVAPRSMPENLERLARIVAEQNPETGANWVAVAGGRIVGMCRPYRDADGRVHVGALYVDRAWHGSGVASALMERIIEFAGAGQPIQLQVAVYNHRARAFYRKWDFADESGTESLYDGVIEEITMIRPGGAPEACASPRVVGPDREVG
jgi:ribosomal protein S18 acetylase RimI-like enzyme